MLLDNEVGFNLDMTGGRNIGGQKLLCDKVCNSQRKATGKAKYITFIGLTNLLDEHICCNVIIESKERLFDIWYCIDLSKEEVGDESDGEEYFRMNVGFGRYCTGGTSFTYKGEIVPSLVKFS